MRPAIWIILVMIIGISACQEPIDITLPDKEAKVVVVANINPNDFMRVFVSRERLINSPDPTTYVNDADVSISLNGRELGLFTYVPPNGQYPDVPYYESNFRPKTGRIYTLEVDVPEGPTIRALNTIPDEVTIQQVFSDSVRVDFPFLDRNEAIFNFFGKIQINDPGGVNNFYHFAEVIIPIDWFSFSQGDTCCIQENKESFLVPITKLDSQNPDFLSLRQENGFIFNDRNFDGQTKLIPFRASLQINTGFQRVSKIFILLRSVSGDYFRYHSSFTRQLAARESPLAEPVIVFNNMENGLGNFSGYSTAVDSITLAR